MLNKKWSNIDLEEVHCFRCKIKGNLLYKNGPFGIVKCTECTQIFISPRLKESVRADIYKDSNYFDKDVYGFSKRLNFGLALQKIWSYGRLGFIEKLLNEKARGKKLLEIGCAYGFFLEAARQKGFEVVGIEYSNVAVKWVKKNLGLNVYHGEIEKVQLPLNYYDVSCFWDVVEHVENPLLFLKAVSRVTKKDGIVVFSCPYFNSFPASIFRSKWWTLRPEQHLWHFTPNTLNMLFSDAKLKLIKIIKNPFSRTNLCRLDSLIGIAQK